MESKQIRGDDADGDKTPKIPKIWILGSSELCFEFKRGKCRISHKIGTSFDARLL